MQENNIQLSPDVSDEFSLQDILARYLIHWKYFILSIIICGGAAWTYLRYSTNQYMVRSTVMIKDDSKGRIAEADPSTVFNNLGINTGSGNVDNEIEVLKSRTLMRQVVDSLNLNVGYYQEGRIKNKEIYLATPVTLTVENQKEAGWIKVLSLKNNQITVESETPAFKKTVQIGETFDSPFGLLTFQRNESGQSSFPVAIWIKSPGYLPGIGVSLVNKVGSIVALTTVGENPRKSADIVNTLVDVYNQQAIEDKNYVANRTIEFINTRLDPVSSELSESELNAEAYRKQHNMTDVQAETQMLIASSGESAKKITDIEIQLNTLGALKNELVQGGDKLMPTNIGLNDPTTIRLIGEYNQFFMEKERVTKGMTDANPEVIKYNARLVTLRTELLNGIRAAESNLGNAANEFRRQERMHAGRMQGMLTQEREFGEISREKKIKESLLVYLLQKKEETYL